LPSDGPRLLGEDDGVESWPLVLAGPIVRRVEPGLVSVWVALKEPRSIRLSVWQGVTAAGSADGLFSGSAPLVTGDASTIRVGERLHVAVVTASPPGALAAGQTYAYNLSFGEPGAAFAAKEDLNSLGLLTDRAATTGENAQPRHAALGYEPNQLPTFVLPPPDIAGLRIAHGSCRRPHAAVADLLPTLDELIRTGRGAVEMRPQQLFLTGDQIYADDVATSLLHMLTPIANELMGSVEHLPTRWSLPPSQGGVRLEPAERSRFPAGLRKAVVMEDAKLTTVDGANHLLSLGEFVGMHLLCWSNALWPAAMPTYADVYWGETLTPLSDFDEVLAGIALPPDLWRLHTGLGFDTEHGIRHRYADAPDLASGFEAINVGRLLTRITEDAAAARGYAKETEVVRAFRDGLPEARRALANIATYMICDDHEVTDDWNLTELWKDRVYTSPLGRTVLRNGILGYAVCQAWGNDPSAFAAAGSPQRRLLEAVPKLFPAGEQLPPHTATSDEVDRLLGLDGSESPVRWDYSVTGAKHRVLVLDVRTRRAFSTRVSPPSNLSPKALTEQIPAGPLPIGLEVLLVVAPLPVFGIPLIDEIGGSLAYRLFDATHHSDIAGMPGTNPDAAEAWVQDPLTFEALLKRLAPYRKVIILSGDVHYAHSGEASYWTKAEATPSRFAQFTASGIKNVWPHTVVTLSRSFAFAQALERLANPVELLGWDSESPDALDVPDDVDVLPPARARLRRSPVLLPAHGWPPGTTTARVPDWSWRFRLSRDARPTGSLPKAAQPAPLDEGSTADVAPTIEGYRRAAQRHASQLARVSHTRQVLFDSNIGVVSLHRLDGRLSARHEVWAKPQVELEPGKTPDAGVYTLHEVVLERAADDPAEPKPTIVTTS
jgi:hypothetical protein